MLGKDIYVVGFGLFLQVGFMDSNSANDQKLKHKHNTRYDRT